MKAVSATEFERRQGRSAAARRSAQLTRADALCRDQELNLTPLRRRVLKALVEACTPLGAYELAERISRPDRKITPTSVYRMLHVLTTLGLVQRIAVRNAYVARESEDQPGEAVVFLICRHCGCVGETASPEVERGLGQAVASIGFRPLERVLEIEGECAACQIGSPIDEADHVHDRAGRFKDRR